MRTKIQKTRRRQKENLPIDVFPINDGNDIPPIPIRQAAELAGVKNRGTKIKHLQALKVTKSSLTWSEFEDFYKMSLWCRAIRLGNPKGKRRAEYLTLKAKNLLDSAFDKYGLSPSTIADDLRRIKDELSARRN